MTASAPIAFIDLQAQRARMGAALQESILRVVRSGRYIMGPEVGELERELAEFRGAPYALSCANRTDALALLLKLKELKPGQAVLVPSIAFAATGEVVVWFGATPIFVDCDEATFGVDPASVEAGVARAKALGLEPVGVIAVDLFGHPADYDALEPIARKNSGRSIRGAAWARWAISRRPVSFRPGRSAATATAGRFSCATRNRSRRSNPCACTAKARTNTTTCASA